MPESISSRNVSIESPRDDEILVNIVNWLEYDALKRLYDCGVFQDGIFIDDVIANKENYSDDAKEAISVITRLRYLIDQARRFSLTDTGEFDTFIRVLVEAILLGRESIFVSEGFENFVIEEIYSNSSRGGRTNVNNNYEPRRKRARAIFDDLWWNDNVRHKTAKAWADAIKKAAPDDREIQVWSLRTLSGEIVDWEEENSSRGSEAVP